MFSRFNQIYSKNLFDQQYDLIVTNPPYVDEEDLTDMPEEFHYEPELALGSGIDGLESRNKF